VEKLHKYLDLFAARYCPVICKYDLAYHWSIMQVEYATDIAFKKQSDLQGIYDHLVRTAIHSVKPENIASFLGSKLHMNYKGEIGKQLQHPHLRNKNQAPDGCIVAQNVRQNGHRVTH
jgi:hypothetical protein